MESTEMTVGDLHDRLSTCDSAALLQLAMNPYFPMSHRPAQIIQTVDENGRSAVYLAEGNEAETQLGPLPPEVAAALAWHEPAPAPRQRIRRGADGN
ncbi:hypothetical protein RM572_26410 [Streptomyces sp. DSM 42041]|uniref:Uncharacterized protein n=1 Tax=Streptomyces hazeniae TaxID=3075538 RepID=A0ABU2P0N1_9ACTN|nr:hypothetical protein [Streptomyces sp. DSM 42041]MDT0382297.1 hypothetical protein [Streptomyces sp. DSM 42041]